MTPTVPLVLKEVHVMNAPRGGGVVLEWVTIEGVPYAAVLHPKTAKRLGGLLSDHADQFGTTADTVDPVPAIPLPDNIDYVI